MACASVLAVALAAVSTSVLAQSLDDVLDEDQYLNGLVELRLPEVIEQYAATVAANDPIRLAKVEIARRRLAATDPAASAENRLAALEESLELRAKLIEAHRNHRDRVLWMGDQAAALYFELWPIDAAGLTALFGLPSEHERLRAQRAAGEMHSLMSRADEALDFAIANLHAQPDFARSEALQARRQRLIDQERDRRLAFLNGIGAVLHAEVNRESLDDEARRDLYRQAADSLAAVSDLLGGRLVHIALVHAALAHARLGEFDEAETILQRVATDQSAHQGELFLTRMVGVINRTQRGGPASGLTAIESIEPRYAGREDLFFRVLLAEHRFTLLKALALAEPDAAQRARTMQQAYGAITKLLTANVEGVAGETLRAIVYEKLIAATSGDEPSLADMPPMVVLARAENLLRQDARSDEAIVELTDLASRPGADDALRAEALFSLAHALARRGEALAAAARFLELASRHPTHQRADDAIGLAIALANQRRADAGAADHAAAVTLFDQCLQLMLDRFAHLPAIDQWLYAAGRFELAAGNWSAAMARFQRITPEADQWPDAAFMQVLTLQQRSDAETSPQERRQRLDELQRLAGRLRPLLSNRVDRETDEARARQLRHHRDTMRLFEAAALLELDDLSRVVPLLHGIELVPDQDPALIARALRLRIQAYDKLGRGSDARREIEQYMTAAPRQFPAVVLPMLQSLVDEVRRMQDAGDEAAAAEHARTEVVPLARLAWQWLSEHNPGAEESVPLQALIALSLRLGGEFADALRLYDSLLRRSPDALELLLGRAECLYSIGAAASANGGEMSGGGASGGGGDERRLGEAMLIYRRIAAAIPDTALDEYWLSQLRMLQILDKTGKNTDKIAPRIEQLRRRDASFGGAQFQRWFVELQNKYS